MHSSADGLCSVSFYSIKSYDCDKSWHSLGKKKKSKSCIYTVSTGEKKQHISRLRLEFDRENIRTICS